MTHNKLINDAINWFKQLQLKSKETAETLRLKGLKARKFNIFLRARLK